MKKFNMRIYFSDKSFVGLQATVEEKNRISDLIVDGSVFTMNGPEEVYLINPKNITFVTIKEAS